MNGNLSNKDVSYVHVMISDIKRTSHHAVIITNYSIWHQSLKSIHYRILLIFQTKKARFEGQNMGGIKDMLSPPCQNMGGIHTPHPPRDLRPCQAVQAIGSYVSAILLLFTAIYTGHAHNTCSRKVGRQRSKFKGSPTINGLRQ